MAKTRLSKNKRDQIVQIMLTKWEAAQPLLKDSVEAAELLRAGIAFIQEKFPPADIAILRKYGLTACGTDLKCRYGEDVFGPLNAFSNVGLIPYSKSYSGSIYDATEALYTAYTKYTARGKALETLKAKKRQKYRDFVYAQKYVEDIEAIVALPTYLKKCASTAIAAINYETIKEIEQDFSRDANTEYSTPDSGFLPFSE